MERDAGAPTLSQCVEEVVRLSKLQRVRTSQGIETGDTVRDGLETMCSETTTDQYIVYDIKNGDV